MIANCFGLFGITNYDDARNMTLVEYRLRMKGYLMAYIEAEHMAYVSAFAQRVAQATDSQGYYKYKKISDVYDREVKRRQLLGRKKKSRLSPRLYQIARNVQEYNERR